MTIWQRLGSSIKTWWVNGRSRRVRTRRNFKAWRMRMRRRTARSLAHVRSRVNIGEQVTLLLFGVAVVMVLGFLGGKAHSLPVPRWVWLGSGSGLLLLLAIALIVLGIRAFMRWRATPARTTQGNAPPAHAPAHASAGHGGGHHGHSFSGKDALFWALALLIVAGAIWFIENHFSLISPPVPLPVAAQTAAMYGPGAQVREDPCSAPPATMYPHTATAQWEKIPAPKLGYRLCIRNVTIQCRSDEGDDEAGWQQPTDGTFRQCRIRSNVVDPTTGAIQSTAAKTFYLNRQNVEATVQEAGIPLPETEEAKAETPAQPEFGAGERF
jgi:hypothetical protein